MKDFKRSLQSLVFGSILFTGCDNYLLPQSALDNIVRNEVNVWSANTDNYFRLSQLLNEGKHAEAQTYLREIIEAHLKDGKHIDFSISYDPHVSPNVALDISRFLAPELQKIEDYLHLK